jgi:hypothetical protein
MFLLKYLKDFGFFTNFKTLFKLKKMSNVTKKKNCKLATKLISDKVQNENEIKIKQKEKTKSTQLALQVAFCY